jgi:CRP-like cAMP-binding protein
MILPEVFDWAKSHYRDRDFSKNETIPTRPGLLYLVKAGAVRLVGSRQEIDSNSPSENREKVFLGLIGAGQPFEIITQFPFLIEARAHVEATSVIWLYWQDLQQWQHLQEKVLEAFRYQHQRKLLWLSILGQKRTIDRLRGFLNLLREEHGVPTEQGYCLPYPITHGQIASAIGANRVTVTRLMGKLRQQGLITVAGENLIIK